MEKSLEEFTELLNMSYKTLAKKINNIYDYQQEDIKIIGKRNTSKRNKELNFLIIALSMKADNQN